MDRRAFLRVTGGGIMSSLLARHAFAAPSPATRASSASVAIPAGAESAARATGAATGAATDAATGASAPAARAIIVLWMNGGPSHIDTWDPKPNTKAGGPTRSIKTRLRGLEISEHMPAIAEVADRLCVLRGMSSTEGNHQRAQYLLHTSYRPNPTVEHPSLGAWIAKKLGPPTGGLPSFVSIGGPSHGAGFLGPEYGPFVVPSAGGLPESVVPAVDDARDARRLALLERLEARFSSEVGGAMVDDRRAVYASARRLMKSPGLRAFDLSNESARAIAAYGDSAFGRGCMTARNLVAAGARFVEVTLDGWDTHSDNFTRVKQQLAVLDPAMSALLHDLSTLPDPAGGGRPLLDTTLVLWMGDFGRTPAINARDGRDHHPQAWTAVMAGAGVAPGVLGATDAAGAKPLGTSWSAADLLATAASQIGLSPSEEAMSRAGRPIAVTDSGTPIARASAHAR
jgi:uncharacterized protein (DUF1501 family)